MLMKLASSLHRKNLVGIEAMVYFFLLLYLFIQFIHCNHCFTGTEYFQMIEVLSFKYMYVST